MLSPRKGSNLLQWGESRKGTLRWSKPASPQQGGTSGRSLLLHHRSRAHGTRHPSARSQRSFWCKTTCTSKCFRPSVRHRQRFPISLMSLTPIYFKILHRKKTPKPDNPQNSSFTGPHLKLINAKRGSCWVLLASDQALLPHGANLFIRRWHSYWRSARRREDHTRDTTRSLRAPQSSPRSAGGSARGV